MVAFYPASGYRNSASGAFGVVGSNGYAWSCAVTDANAYNLNFNNTSVNPMNSGNRATARAVRCVQYLFKFVSS